MRPWRFLLFVLLFVCFSVEAFPAVFVVTSKADSGPGTLREALTKAAANGSAEKDYINFNLPDLSEVGRTIMLTTQLPDVSSNLVIDGSTQPGVKFGVSDARVGVFFNTPVEQTLSGLSVVNQHDVEIYGLYIKNLADVTKLQTLYFWKGIELKNDKNIQVGAAGKGNVITGFYEPLIVNFPVNEPEFFENLVLKDNFFGVDADGETLSVNEITPVSINFIVGKVTIGGTVSEGNLFTQGLSIYQQNMYDSDNPEDYYSSTPADFMIKNNKLGVDYYVQKEIPKSNGLNLETVDPGGKNTYHIEDNVITSNSYAIFIGNNGRPISILRNYIGTDKTRTKTFKTQGIFLYGATEIAIGNDNPANANYITNCNPISVWPYTNVTINKNSIYCTVNASAQMHLDAWNEFLFPDIKILKISANSVAGTATPNSNIELFYSDVCKTCSPQTYFASTKADPNGKWAYTGKITGAVIASATLNGNTSEFTRTSINTDNIKIINACGPDGVGSIKGAVPTSAANIKWVDEKGTTVGHNTDLLNVKPGKYKLIVNNGDCAASTAFFEIRKSFIYDASQLVLTNPSCNGATGSIIGLQVFNNADGISSGGWKDASGNMLNNDRNLLNVPAGRYYYTVTTGDQNCTEIFGPFTLINTTGPNIDQSTANVQSTNCGQSAGSITNITVTGTGTLKYIWWNSSQQQVAATKDLTGQPGGVYKLQVTDDTQCGPIYTNDITIPETNGIILDESKAIKTVASCGQANGTITGITASGATTYQWTDINNNAVSGTADLTGVPAGDYKLTVSNAFGCSKASQVYHVDLQAITQFPQYAASIVSSCFQGQDGAITISTDALVKSLRWVDGQGDPAGNQPGLTGVKAGTYKLYLTDLNGCEQLYNTYTVGEEPEYRVASTGETIADKCALKTGAISNVTITGGVPPYTYKWTDAANNIVGTSNSIANLGAGNYVLNVVDTRCGNVDIPYTITEESAEVAPPAVSDVQLCSSGSAVLTVKNPSATTTYRLYESASGARPIVEQQGGRFNVTVSGNRSYFISQLNGTCESSRSEVKVTVGLSLNDIANAFTPNADGINDYWKIAYIESYPDALVQVFTRYGRNVFESRGYTKPFDGTMNGKKLPAGVYYYIINLNTDCNILSGSLTIIR